MAVHHAGKILNDGGIRLSGVDSDINAVPDSKPETAGPSRLTQPHHTLPTDTSSNALVIHLLSASVMIDTGRVG